MLLQWVQFIYYRQFQQLVSKKSQQQLQIQDGGINYTCTRTGKNITINYFHFSCKHSEKALQSRIYTAWYVNKHACLFYQNYSQSVRDLTKTLVQRAERAGFEALVLTVDAPYFGKRRENLRGGFGLPPHLRYTFIHLIFFLFVCVHNRHIYENQELYNDLKIQAS